MRILALPSLINKDIKLPNKWCKMWDWLCSDIISNKNSSLAIAMSLQLKLKSGQVHVETPLLTFMTTDALEQNLSSEAFAEVLPRGYLTISLHTYEGIVLFSSNHAKLFTITGQRGLLLWGSKRGREGEEQKRDSKSCRWDDFGFDDCGDVMMVMMMTMVMEMKMVLITMT